MASVNLAYYLEWHPYKIRRKIQQILYITFLQKMQASSTTQQVRLYVEGCKGITTFESLQIKERIRNYLTCHSDVMGVLFDCRLISTVNMFVCSPQSNTNYAFDVVHF